MVKVDSKGRIVLPQELRDQLDITPGTEVHIHEEDGKAVVEPENNPREILDRMTELIEETAPETGETTPPADSVDPIADKHQTAVRKAANNASDE